MLYKTTSSMARIMHNTEREGGGSTIWQHNEATVPVRLDNVYSFQWPIYRERLVFFLDDVGDENSCWMVVSQPPHELMSADPTLAFVFFLYARCQTIGVKDSTAHPWMCSYLLLGLSFSLLVVILSRHQQLLQRRRRNGNTCVFALPDGRTRDH